MKTLHQQRMQLANQELPTKPEIPNPGIRHLRASLILEEALETIEALGLGVWAQQMHSPLKMAGVEITEARGLEPDLVAIVDGCCDLSVVTTGTLSACGVSDDAVQREVDLNKFGEGYSLRPDGKLIKPPGHLPPDLRSILRLKA